METFKDKFRREWSAFAAMTPRQKLEHIWIYYKIWIAVLLLLIAVAASAISSIRYNSRHQLISGIFLNTTTTAEGYAHLKEDYWQYRGAHPNQRTELIETRTLDMENLPENDAANLMVVVSMIAAKTLDYVIVDESALNLLDEQEVLLDLRELLPEDTLLDFSTRESPTGIIAISLRGTAFANQFPVLPEESWLAIINNTPDRAETAQFVNYLLFE